MCCILQAHLMITHLMSAFHELLAENQWMDDETRKSAAEKVDAMYILAGFPSWTDSAAQLDQFYEDVSLL